MGGTKFCVALVNMAEAELNVIREIDTYISSQMVVNQKKVNLHCNYGVAVYPKDSTVSWELLQKADMANYFAKRKKNNHVLCYQPEMTYKINWKSNLNKYMEKAQKEGSLALSIQDTIRLDTGELNYRKINVIVKKPFGGNFDYQELLGLSEELDMRDKIVENVTHKICDYIREQDALGYQYNYGVSISTAQLMDVDLMSRYFHYLKRIGLDCRRIYFEVFEVAAVEDYDLYVIALHKCANRGVRVIISNMLNGQVGIKLVPQLPIYGVRIGRWLLKRLEGSRREYEYADGIIHAFLAISIEVIADGIDDSVMREHARQIGIQSGRGDAISEAQEIRMRQGE